MSRYLATVTLASQQQAFVPVWLGSTLGMVIADGLAIWIGVAAGQRLPARAIQLGAALIFLAFGAWTLLSALLGWGGLGYPRLPPPSGRC